MRLAKLIVEARYDRPPRALGGFGAQLARAFAQELGAQPVIPSDPTIRHEISFTRDRVIFGCDATRTGVDVNWPEDEERAAARAIAYMEKAQRVLDLDDVTRVGIRSVWVEPRPVPFERLVEVLKAAWLSGTSDLINEGVDVGLSLIHRHRDNRVNVAAGPIRADEFPRWGLPANEDLAAEPMLLVDVDYAYAGRLHYGRLVRLESIREVLSYARDLADQAASETTIEEAAE